MALTWRAVVLMACGIVPVLLVPVPGTVLLWLSAVALVCFADAALAASPRRIGVRREVPSSVRLTTSTTSRLVLTNLSRRTLRATVRDAWVPSAGAEGNRHEVTVASGDGTRVVTPLLPTRRGDRRADRVTIRAYGPLRLAARQASIPVEGRLRVLPEFASRKHLPSRLARLREMDGRTAVQVRGEGTEFDSLREYVIGDDVRSIDWRATARRNDVVVRTWRPERDRRVLIVLDTSRTSAARIQDSLRLDAGIEAALLLSALADRAGDRIELIAFDRSVKARVAGAAGPRLLPAMADALAVVEPALVEPDWPGIVAAVQERLSQRALVVLLSTLDASSVEGGLLPVIGQLSAIHQVVVAAVADPEVEELRNGRESSAEVYDAAAAARVTLERTAVTTVLRRRGVEVVDATPEELAPKVADTYLALKAAGRL